MTDAEMLAALADPAGWWWGLAEPGEHIPPAVVLVGAPAEVSSGMRRHAEALESRVAALYGFCSP